VSGFKGYAATQWFSVAASKDIPAAQLDQVNAALRAAVATPEFKAALDNAGMIAGGGSRDELQSFIQADSAKWQKLIDSGAVKLAN
jgi:tripartite-type tricarboxylate transporter receptor subunit TctC